MQVNNQVFGVVLAAGASSRMGSSKMALPWADSSVLETVLTNVLHSRAADHLLVTGGYQQIVESLPLVAKVERVHNANYAAGEMISSIKLALERVQALSKLPDAVFVLPGDMPFVTASIINQIIQTSEKYPEAIIAPIYNGQRGHPVLFPFEIFERFKTLPAESAPRDLVKQYKQRLRLVEMKDPAVLIDIDTPEAYAKYKPQSS